MKPARATSALSPVCILAGGLGTRLGDRVRTTPKPLIAVAGKPFVLHQLELLARHGARRIVMCIGHLGEQIVEVVGDGSAFGLDVSYSEDGPLPAGTAGALRRARHQLGERFLVLYGDTYLRIDYRDVDRALERSESLAVMTVLHNHGALDTSNAVVCAGRVLRYDKRRFSAEMEWIDYGVSAFRTEALDVAAPEASDLADVQAELARLGQLASYEATLRFYEIGTPGGLAETEAFLIKNARADKVAPQTGE